MKIRVITLLALVMAGVVKINAQMGEIGRFRTSIEFGYSYRFGEVSDNLPNDVKEYAKDLKNGTTLYISAGYFIQETWGLGAYFSRFSSDNSGRITSPTDSNAKVDTRDDINITFIAPQFLYRSLSANNKHSLLSTFSIGYLGYKDDGIVGGNSLEITGGTVGIGVGLNYDFHITPSFAIGAGANFIAGSVSKLKVSVNGQSQTLEVEEFSGEDRENLSRINLSAGIRFYL